jgi:hypothetical protein
MAGAAAWLLVAEEHADDLEERFAAARELGLECVVDIRDDDELGRVLASVGPEIILLSPRAAEHDEEAVDRVLELLPDVPAGMLAIAELRGPTAGDVLALERAGVDVVLVDVADLAPSRRLNWRPLGSGATLSPRGAVVTHCCARRWCGAGRRLWQRGDVDGDGRRADARRGLQALPGQVEDGLAAPS